MTHDPPPDVSAIQAEPSHKEPSVSVSICLSITEICKVGQNMCMGKTCVWPTAKKKRKKKA